MKINLNTEVTFTINQHGLEVLAAEDQKYGRETGGTAVLLRCNASTMQCKAPLWQVMSLFGPSMKWGTQKNPIAGNFLELESRNLALVP